MKNPLMMGPMVSPVCVAVHPKDQSTNITFSHKQQYGLNGFKFIKLAFAILTNQSN